MSKVPYGLMPLYPYIDLTIGDNNLTSNPQSHIMDFSYERKSNVSGGFGGSMFNFTLYDDTALFLEGVLAEGFEDVKFRYGYNYDSNYSSSWVNGKVEDYSLSFEAGGITLDLSGTVTGLSDNVSTQQSIEYLGEEYNGQASEVVKAVISEMGWEIGEIEPTVPELESGSPKTFLRENETAIDFIDSLCEDSVSESTGNRGYYYYLEGNKFYFKSMKSQSEGGKSQGDFEYYCGRANQAVISFSPDFKGKIAFIKYGNVEAESIDKLSNTIINNSSLGLKTKSVSGSSKTVLGGSSIDSETLKGRVQSISNLYSSYGYTATMEILGDPTLEIYSNVKVYVFTKYSVMHHTSGEYFINSITDSISGGTFTSSLGMKKVADVNGESDSAYDLDDGSMNGDTSTDGSFINGNDAGNYPQSTSTDTEAKMKEVTGGRGINRYSDSQSFCSSLITTIKVRCRDEKGKTYDKSLQVNKYVVDSVRAIFDDIYNTTTFCIRNSDTGGYSYRNVSGTNKLSYHSYGIALDINWNVNPYYKNAGGSDDNLRVRTSNHPVVQIFQKHGWGWGGRYHDYMHFSYFNGD